jgi:hypothetical protein
MIKTTSLLQRMQEQSQQDSNLEQHTSQSTSGKYFSLTSNFRLRVYIQAKYFSTITTRPLQTMKMIVSTRMTSMGVGKAHGSLDRQSKKVVRASRQSPLQQRWCRLN